jgi:hypothetical protein
LPGRIFDPELGDGRIVVTQTLQFSQQRLGKLRSAQCREALDLSRTQDRQNSRTNRHAQPELAQIIPELEKVIVREEKLRENKVSAAIHLCLQTLPVHKLAFPQAMWPSGNPAVPIEKPPSSRRNLTS